MRICFVWFLFLQSYTKGFREEEDKSHYKKVNGVDEIVWINLDRSLDRRLHMEEVLISYVPIPNRRISAVDGANEDLGKYFHRVDATPSITQLEIACSLSHLKAIHSLKSQRGDSFLILEDDAVFDNMKMIPYDFEQIIRLSPPDYDIVQVFAFRNSESEELIRKRNFWDTASSGAYIISRKGIDRMVKRYPMENGKCMFPFSEMKISECMIYDDMDTYTFKYNCVDSYSKDSTIHPDHLPFQRQSIDGNRELMKRDFGSN